MGVCIVDFIIDCQFPWGCFFIIFVGGVVPLAPGIGIHLWTLQTLSGLNSGHRCRDELRKNHDLPAALLSLRGHSSGVLILDSRQLQVIDFLRLVQR